MLPFTLIISYPSTKWMVSCLTPISSKKQATLIRFGSPGCGVPLSLSMIGVDFSLQTQSFSLIDNTWKLFSSDGSHRYVVCTHDTNILVCRSCEVKDEPFIRAMIGQNGQIQAFRCMSDDRGPTDKVRRAAIQIRRTWFSFRPSSNGRNFCAVDDLKEMEEIRSRKMKIKPSIQESGVPGELRRVWDYYVSDKYTQNQCMWVTQLQLREIAPTPTSKVRSYYAPCKPPKHIQPDSSEEE